MRIRLTRLARSAAVLAASALAGLALLAAPAAASPVSDGAAAGPNGRVSAAAPDTPRAVVTVTAAAGLPAGYTINGIDVSSHDHAGGRTVNWAGQRAAGDEFAFVKATEGTGYVNPYYDQDYHGAKNAGLSVGAYAFGRPDLGNPLGQANFLVDHMQWVTDGKTLPPFLDLEWPYTQLGLPDCYGLSQSAMRSWISAFQAQVQARIGRPSMIYTNANWWNPCTGSSPAFAGYPLDVSSCNSTPPPVPGWGTRWTFWQYDIDACHQGALHDSNVFNGTLVDLAALAGAVTGVNGVVAGDVTGDGRSDLLARRPDGTLWLYANGGNNTAPYSTGVLVGTSWQQFGWFLTGEVTGDGRADLVAEKTDGTLWLYTNGGSNTAPYSTGVLIGTSWQQFRNIALADVTGDGRADLLAVKPDGTLWLYTNSGNTTAPYSGAILIGTDWQQFTSVTAGDVTGDGRADVVAVKPDGTLWLYTNSGNTTAPYNGATRIGTGWQGLARLQASDVTGDGRADLTATQSDGTLWLYTNGGNTTAPYSNSTLIGTGWQEFA